MENEIFISDKVAEIKEKLALGLPVIAVETPDNRQSIAALNPKPNAIHIGWEDMDPEWVERVRKRAYGIPWTILETKRTVLRELAASDVDDLIRLYGGHGITDYVEPLFEREEEIKYQENYRKYIYDLYGFGLWGVFDRQSGDLIGRAGLDPRDGNVELGYIIASDRQRQGLGFEVCAAILDYAAGELGLTDIICTINEENIPSVRLALKLGFERTGNYAADNRMIYGKNIQILR